MLMLMLLGSHLLLMKILLLLSTLLRLLPTLLLCGTACSALHQNGNDS
jgi:hypothetical protein